MGSIACDFVSQTLGGDLSNFRENFFIDVEIVGELLIVPFEEHLGGSLDGLCADSAHKIYDGIKIFILIKK